MQRLQRVRRGEHRKISSRQLHVSYVMLWLESRRDSYAADTQTHISCIDALMLQNGWHALDAHQMGSGVGIKLYDRIECR